MADLSRLSDLIWAQGYETADDGRTIEVYRKDEEFQMSFTIQGYVDSDAEIAATHFIEVYEKELMKAKIAPVKKKRKKKGEE